MPQSGFAGSGTANYPVVSLPGQQGLWYQQPGGLYTQVPNSGPVGPSSGGGNVGPSGTAFGAGSNGFSMGAIGTGSMGGYGAQFGLYSAPHGAINLPSVPLITENEGWAGMNGGRYGGANGVQWRGLGGGLPGSSGGGPSLPASMAPDPGYAHASDFSRLFFGDRAVAQNPFTYF